VVVLGDLKVGKSSFLNFLLGDEILASKVEHCTSTITEVSYGEKIRVFAQKRGENDLVEYKVDTRGGAKKALESFLAADLQHRDEIQFERVCIHCPSPFLKSGIVLVDSPGLNEHSHFDTLTKTYLANAVGIICVINSDPGLTLTVQQAIAQVKERCVCPEFLFVCNKIDTIKKETDKRAKLEEIRQKLTSMRIPSFEPEDLVAFSTTQSVAARSYGVISQHLDTLNSKLTRHMKESFKLKLKIHYNDFHLIFKRVADAVQLVAELTDPKRHKLEESLRELHNSVEKQQQDRNAFENDERRLIQDWHSKVQQVYKTAETKIKGGWHTYADGNIVVSKTRSDEYEDYVEKMLQRELVLRLDQIDSETGVLEASAKDITDNKFHKLTEHVNMVLYVMDKKVDHNKSILARLEKVGIQSINAEEYFTEFHKTAKVFNKTLQQFKISFL